MKPRQLPVALGVVVIALVAGCGGSGSKHYDAGATHDCLIKSPDYVGLDWYPGKPNAPSPPIPFQLLDGGRRTGFSFYGHLPYHGTNVGSGHELSLMFTSFRYPPVGLVFFANSEQARYAYREMLAKVDPTLVQVFKAATRLDQNLFIDWGTTGEEHGPAKPVSAIVQGCLRTV